MPNAIPAGADLNDPLYYLNNARTLINWVRERHGDLLTQTELYRLDCFDSLPEQAQALLIRMVMRRGELFRSDQLQYAELSAPPPLLARLAEVGFILLNPALTVEELASLLRKSELWQVCHWLNPDAPPPKQSRKQDLVTWITQTDHGPMTLEDWLPDAGFGAVSLEVSPLMQRLQLMFFGNLYQDWSAFVVTELGHQLYESVPLDSASRAFHQRSDVDLYLALHTLQQRLEQGEPLHDILNELPECGSTPWLENRRRKLMFALGQAFERAGQLSQARALYAQNPHREARIRQLRLMERMDLPAATFEAASASLAAIQQPEAQLRVHRIRARSARKAGISIEPPHQPVISTHRLRLPLEANKSVEQAVIAHLTTQGIQAFHVENRLFTGLFALLYWPAIFAPVPGAFFHPFQAGPADLYRPEFQASRQALIDACTAQLETGDYRETIQARLAQKQNIRCHLIHWPSMTEERVNACLTLVPAEHLKQVFLHMLKDLRYHRRGLPDLICFDWQARRYQLIEVKGPGDRLQDHQRLWLECFQAQGIPASVYRIEYEKTE